MKWVFRFFMALVIDFGVIQLVPYGWDRSNPAVAADTPWNSPRTAALVHAACYDCHSNETVWPWYSTVAPLSWLSVYDVKKGRDELNFSRWPRIGETREVVESVREGEMPPLQYVLLHPEARLSDSEIQELVVGLRATLSQ
jgi:hypothetical protein